MIQCWTNHLKPNYMKSKAEVVLVYELKLLNFINQLKLKSCILFFFSVDQLEELLKQLEKEKDLKCEEASKELNNVRAQVEYNRRGLEQREMNAEALVSEVQKLSTQKPFLNINKLDIIGYHLFFLIFFKTCQRAAINKNIIEVKDSATAKQQILLAKEDEVAKEVKLKSPFSFFLLISLNEILDT